MLRFNPKNLLHIYLLSICDYKLIKRFKKSWVYILH